MTDKKLPELKTIGAFNHGGYMGNTIFLDHSCDEWVIGSVEDLEKFLEEGKAMLDYLKSKEIKEL